MAKAWPIDTLHAVSQAGANSEWKFTERSLVMSAAETKAVAALIRIMPLMRREFAQSVDSRIFFSDSAYANAVLDKAEHAKDDRIVITRQG